MLDFWGFVNERMRIWHKRMKGLPRNKWTNDPVLLNYKFCNVYRELDRGTQYVISSIIRNTDMSERDKLLNLMFYRLFNLPETHMAVSDILRVGCNLEEVYDRLIAHKNVCGKVFSDAYMITGQSSVSKSKDKIKMLIDVFKKDIMPKLNQYYGGVRYAGTMAEAWNVLRQIPNLGDFIGYQVLLDWCYLDNVKFQDYNSWCYPGPGALKGLKYVFGKDVSIPEARRLIFDLTKNQRLEKDLRWNNHPLSIHNVENCLCEYGKYVRIWQGSRNVKARKFSPASYVEVPLDPWEGREDILASFVLDAPGRRCEVMV
jgi:hypothetical protein